MASSHIVAALLVVFGKLAIAVRLELEDELEDEPFDTSTLTQHVLANDSTLLGQQQNHIVLAAGEKVTDGAVVMGDLNKLVDNSTRTRQLSANGSALLLLQNENTVHDTEQTVTNATIVADDLQDLVDNSIHELHSSAKHSALLIQRQNMIVHETGQTVTNGTVTAIGRLAHSSVSAMPEKDIHRRRIRWFLVSSLIYVSICMVCHCAGLSVVFSLLPVAFFCYIQGVFLFLILQLVALGFYICCGCPAWTAWLYLKSWPWAVDLYTKLLYLGYQYILNTRSTPNSGPEYMPASRISPKQKLEKVDIAYALNVKVPIGAQEEFAKDPIKFGGIANLIRDKLHFLPQFEYFDTFDHDEDPVKYVMDRLGSVYPDVYQVWTDKHSDEALTRFCLHGIAAHRVDTEFEDGVKFFVIRTNALSKLPVREGFARYGGDAYFDENWRPVKIVDAGMQPLSEFADPEPVVSVPGDIGWEQAKFRFRSSLVTLVTLVDHLYGGHLQYANVGVTAIREQLSADHPVRRFLTPFTFKTISVNHNASSNLVAPRSMGPRVFAFTDLGLSLAFGAAPHLLKVGAGVSDDGTPMLNRKKYTEYLKNVKGIDTEYFRQALKLWLIYRDFIRGYMEYYYKSVDDIANDEELVLMVRQLLHASESVTPCDMAAFRHAARAPSGSPRRASMTLSTIIAPTNNSAIAYQNQQELIETIYDAIATFMFAVTADHEQAGSIQAYVNDVSFVACKWQPGALRGTKQTAITQALLMSFTSMRMPLLLGPGSDWTHLFPDCSDPQPGKPTAIEVFSKFKQQLEDMVAYCDEYDAQAPKRTFPENCAMYTLNPKRLQTSVSV